MRRTSTCPASEPSKAEPAAKAEPEPETEAVAAKPFAVKVELPATFEAPVTHEVAWKPKALGGEVEVVEAAAPGPVEAGQVLVRLKAPRQAEQVEIARLDLALAEVQLQRAVAEDGRREAAQALQRAGVEREAARAGEDLKRWLELERELRRAETVHGLKGSENGLTDSIEELAQLEKMYKADDLTEETEDIVLKRSQRELDRQRERLDFIRQRNTWALAITLPREQENLEQRAKETRMELERFEATAGLALAKARTELKKAQMELEHQRLALGRLEADLEALVLRAPAAGTAWPGVLVRGRWQGVAEALEALAPGEKVRAGQVLMTVVAPGALRVRAQVPEALAFVVAVGDTGSVAPTAADELRLPVTVSRLAATGVDGKHELQATLGEGDPRLLPGHTGTLRLRSRPREAVITVPEAAVQREGDVARVFVRADGASTPREVRLGLRSEGRIEVREGLAAGERVLVKAPAK
ncbi:MAG: HlyD family efflux transporter periplasmic adaptor subunit [Planctomycetia bacterium]